MKPEELAALQAKSASVDAKIEYGSDGIDKGRFDLTIGLAWAAVGVPVLWGAWYTLIKTAAMF